MLICLSSLIFSKSDYLPGLLTAMVYEESAFVVNSVYRRSMKLCDLGLLDGKNSSLNKVLESLSIEDAERASETR